jgi:hypothetical protein
VKIFPIASLHVKSLYTIVSIFELPKSNLFIWVVICGIVLKIRIAGFIFFCYSMRVLVGHVFIGRRAMFLFFNIHFWGNDFAFVFWV